VRNKRPKPDKAIDAPRPDRHRQHHQHRDDMRRERDRIRDELRRERDKWRKERDKWRDWVLGWDEQGQEVAQDKERLREHAAPDGTVTILFTDIEGSTALVERVGDQRWVELLRAHRAIVRAEVAKYNGFEVSSAGDGFMLAFSSARRALQCAIGVQRAMEEYNEAHPGEPLPVRIGLHVGETIKEGDDFLGKAVHFAARIADHANGGEILVSSLVKELTDSAGDIHFENGRDVELRGLSGAGRVYSVIWR
jgi:class 3 adenylate cyclase